MAKKSQPTKPLDPPKPKKRAEKEDNPNEALVTTNRRARFDYHIGETYEAGLQLTGSEVKSLRGNAVNLSDSYGMVKGGEVFLLNCHISPYAQAGYAQHEPLRTRKLLLHKKEIGELQEALERKGMTAVPLKIYFKHGRAKLLLGLGKGKKLFDKREDLKLKDDKREMARAVKRG